MSKKKLKLVKNLIIYLFLFFYFFFRGVACLDVVFMYPSVYTLYV